MTKPFDVIVIGGGPVSYIAAIIDHNKGAAYTYPVWIQIVMGKLLTFDRKLDVEGKPNAGVPSITPVAAK